jgi:hypothetical protein
VTRVLGVIVLGVEARSLIPFRTTTKLLPEAKVAVTNVTLWLSVPNEAAKTGKPFVKT